MKRFLMILMVAALSLPAFAQSDTAVPQSGYWTSTITQTTSCEGAENSTGYEPLPVGYQSVVPMTVSDDASQLSIENFLLTRDESGDYHSAVIPTDPETIPEGETYAEFARASVTSASSIVIERGKVFTSDLCAPFGTYELEFLSEQVPAEETGSFKPGLWAVTNSESSEPLETCQYIAGVISVDDNGFPTINNFRLTPISDTDYSLTIHWETDFPALDISLTAESDDRFTGSYSSVPPTNSAEAACSRTFEGTFVREMSLGAEAGANEAVDSSIIPKSGDWEFAYTEQNVEGDCQNDFNSQPYTLALEVSEDGGTITSSLGWELHRDDNGYYVSAPGDFVVEAVSSELLNLTVEFPSSGCVVTQTGTATWQG